jgi:glutamate synthase (NADPH) large chain
MTRVTAQGLYDPRYEHDACGAGFVVNIKGKQSHQIVEHGLKVLLNLAHRGACGSEHNSGDGAGVLLQLPHKFFQKVAKETGFTLPQPGQYGVGFIFLPQNEGLRKKCVAVLEEVITELGLSVLGWRDVPTHDSTLGKTAKACQPVMGQIFVKRGADLPDDISFERKLFVIKNRVESTIRKMGVHESDNFYIASLSYKTIVYKGMLTCEQLEEYYPDLKDPAMETAIILVHSRFSTNTFPSWDRAHPNRYSAHNGEINTLRGNVNWMHARQAMLKSNLFGDDIKKIFPIISPEGSDSAMFDNCLEFLTLAGRSLPHAVMMMIPEPWSRHISMDPAKKAFYEYHSCLMEPWDGPASIIFSDGVRVGAVLDRNGLRPSRYYVTKDDLVIMASEVGVLEVPPERILKKGRLEPGRMFLIDTEQQRIIADEELKLGMAKEQPYQKWLDANLVKLEDLPKPSHVPEPDHKTVIQRQRAFGYTFEQLRKLLVPMAQDGIDAVGSMGNDAPLAVLSRHPQLLYNYFKQMFAQVTNPAIDAIREEIVTATETTIGSEANLIDPRPESCRLIKIKSPILSNEEMARLTHLNQPGFKSVTLPILYKVEGSEKELQKSLDELFAKADQAITAGNNIIILTDRGISRELAPIPALLAVSGLHHHLIRQGTRTRVGIVLESGEPREVHHLACLLAYGVGAVNPYLVFESLDDLLRQGILNGMSHEQAVKNYIKGAMKGVIKVISKVGISTIQSYRGAQIFEAVGLHPEVIDKYFTWTASRIGGIGLKIIAEEVKQRHHLGYSGTETDGETLPVGGDYQWRKDGELHLFNPWTVHKLQQAVRNNDYAAFEEFSQEVNEQERNTYTLRGLLEFTDGGKAIPLSEVESVESICRRFKTGAMSYGSISKEAHESLAIAMNRIGGKSNTGEGGEDPARYIPDKNGDLRRSAIKQVASGRFGVTSHYLVNSEELQIKIAQGAKPGEGGQLPGSKVYPWIAKVRFSTPGVGLISPPPHHDIYSIEDLAELIHDLKNSNPSARINVKLVAEVGVGTIAAGVAKAHADVILISGYDGGTGASPQTSIKHAGIPWELGLAETHQTLVLNDLRSRVVLETDGQLRTGRDVVIAAMLGAEEFGFATAPLVALGCIMMRVCHLNTCPVGVATQNPELRKKFTGDPQHVVNFMRMIAQQTREIMAQLGFHTLPEMVGRTDRLKIRKALNHLKADTIDFEKILHRPKVAENVGIRHSMSQDHGLERSLDKTILMDLCRPAIEHRETVEATLPIKNIHRVAGTMVGSEISKKYGSAGLPEDTIRLNFKGSAGQSFGAFIPSGMTLKLEGDSNDYIGKGLSGGKIIVYPPTGTTFVPEENIIIGNVAFYGATGGSAFIRGMAGERFCVRNSGATAVVEGVGDHGCEYMTGGRVVVLGRTGRNFAAGMSGGIAYVLDTVGTFARDCNQELVLLEKLSDADAVEVQGLIQEHVRHTHSEFGKRVLQNWHEFRTKIIKVMPKDYKRVLAALEAVKSTGMSGDEAVMAAFEENIRDEARVAGN